MKCLQLLFKGIKDGLLTFVAPFVSLYEEWFAPAFHKKWFLEIEHKRVAELEFEYSNWPWHYCKLKKLPDFDERVRLEYWNHDDKMEDSPIQATRGVIYNEDCMLLSDPPRYKVVNNIVNIDGTHAWFRGHVIKFFHP